MTALTNIMDYRIPKWPNNVCFDSMYLSVSAAAVILEAVNNLGTGNYHNEKEDADKTNECEDLLPLIYLSLYLVYIFYLSCLYLLS